MRALLLFGAVVSTAALGWLVLSASPSVTLSGPGGPAPKEELGRRRLPGSGAGKGPAAGQSGIGAGGQITGTIRRAGKPVGADVGILLRQAIEPGVPQDIRNSRKNELGHLPQGFEACTVKTSAGKDGIFRFSGLAPGDYTVVARSGESGAEVAVSARVRDTFSCAHVHLFFPSKTFSLEGRALYADKSPFSGRIYATSSSGGTVVPAGSVATDSKGRFSLDGFSEGRVTLVAFQPGKFRVAGPTIDVPADHPIQFVVDKGLRSLDVRVVQEGSGSPIPGADVTGNGQRQGGGSVGSAGKTGKDGHCRLLVTETSVWLRVGARGYEVASRTVPKEQKTVEVHLLKLVKVTGKVTEKGSRKPVAGMRVFAIPVGSGSGRGVGQGLSGPDGTYVISDAPPGETMVFAVGNGYVSAGMGKVSQQGYNPFVLSLVPDKEAKVDLVVSHGGVVSGRVLDFRDRPAPGVPVSAVPERRSGRLAEVLAPSRIATDEKGRFRFEGLLTGCTFSFRAQPNDGGPSEPTRVTVREDVKPEIELHLPPVRYAIVEVRDKATGKPVQGASVSLRRKRPHRGSEGVSGGGTTGADGTLRVGPFPAGEISVQVRHSDYMPPPKAAKVPASTGGKDPRIVVELVKGLMIEGTILGPDGGPIDDSGRWRQIGAQGNVHGKWIWRNGTLKENGKFKIAGLPDGKFRLQAWVYKGTGYLQGTASASAGARGVVVRLKAQRNSGAQGKLDIEVLGPGGKPVRSGSVQVRQEAKNNSGTWSSQIADGSAHVSMFADCEKLWVFVSSAKDQDGKPLGTLLQGPMSPPSGTLTLSLPESLFIAGKVVGPDGKGVRGVRVMGYPQTSSEGGGYFGSQAVAWTDAEGAFRLEGLGSFEYLLSVTASGDFVPASSVKARTGETSVEIRLKKGVCPGLHVIDFKGEPVEGARVSAHVLKGSSGKMSSWQWYQVAQSGRRTDSQGYVELDGLDPVALYRLLVVPPTDRLDVLRKKMEDWQPAPGDVTLEQGYVISGMVVDTSGNPVPNATVMWRPSEDQRSGWKNVRTSADGKFSIGRLKPGPVRLKPQIPNGGYSQGDAGATTVQAGVKDLVLTLDRKGTIRIACEGITNTTGYIPWVSLTIAPEGGGAGKQRHQWIPGGSVSDVNGLDPGLSYAIFAQAYGSPTRYAYLGGVVPDGSKVTLTFSPGASIQGTVDLPQGATQASVRASAPALSQGASVNLSTGQFEIHNLPAGMLHVTATVRVGKKVYSGSVDAATGGSVEIPVTARDSNQEGGH